jgi:hypothetical protein
MIMIFILVKREEERAGEGRRGNETLVHQMC